MCDPELTAEIAHRRLEQAQETGAKVILSACQQCKRTLAGQARKEKMRVKVLDIVELVWGRHAGVAFPGGRPRS